MHHHKLDMSMAQLIDQKHIPTKDIQWQIIDKNAKGKLIVNI